MIEILLLLFEINFKFELLFWFQAQILGVGIWLLVFKTNSNLDLFYSSFWVWEATWVWTKFKSGSWKILWWIEQVGQLLMLFYLNFLRGFFTKLLPTFFSIWVKDSNMFSQFQASEVGLKVCYFTI